MEEKILKQILDVVTDIKVDQKIMKEKQDRMEQMQKEMLQRQEKFEEEQALLRKDVNTLLKEQESTKEIVIEVVNKLGEVSSKLDRHIAETEGESYNSSIYNQHRNNKLTLIKNNTDDEN